MAIITLGISNKASVQCYHNTISVQVRLISCNLHILLTIVKSRLQTVLIINKPLTTSSPASTNNKHLITSYHQLEQGEAN